MKYKQLTENQIIISIDRLTRFKITEEKYLRVFKDIIISNLIEPKFKKTELENLSYAEIRDIATEIFNSSIKEKSEDYKINTILKDYENAIFDNSSEIQDLLDNRLDYKSAIRLLNNPEPLNLQWLKEINSMRDGNLEALREKKSILFPVKTVVLVEGITEEILLPKFAEILDFNFNKYGIKIIPAGGKNQVVKLYYKLCEQLKIPIFVLVDKDAVENVEAINKKLRKSDKVYIINCGEFEDLLPKKLVTRTLNSHLINFASVDIDDVSNSDSMVKNLEEIFKEKGLHEFKKAEFAHLVFEQIRSFDDTSLEIRNIISQIRKV